MTGVDALIADLVRIGAPVDVRLDALAGTFTTWTFGDPAALAAAPVPRWLVDASAVRAYDFVADRRAMIAALMPAPRPPVVPAPPRYNPAPPTAHQLEVLTALRRMVDVGERVTVEAIRFATGYERPPLTEILFGLEGRGLIARLPLADFPPWIVLGSRARLYPERYVTRTERSKRIEARLREGATVAEVIEAMKGEAVTRAEVVRVRALVTDSPKKPSAYKPTGANHMRVVEMRRANPKVGVATMAAELGISGERVRQILKNAGRLGDLP